MIAGLVLVAGLNTAFLAAPARAFVVPTPTGASGRYEHIASYDVALQVRRDGGMHVTETIAYDFGGEDRHGITRTIPTHRKVDSTRDRVIRIQKPQVHGEGVGPGDLTVTTSGGDEVLRIGNPHTTVTEIKTYVIEYDVPHALVPRDGKVNELYWDAIGTRWSVPISRVTVTVTAPVGILFARCYRGFEGQRSACSTATTAGTGMKVSESGLKTGEGVTLQVELPQAGMVDVTPPPIERRPAPFAGAAPAGVLALVAVGIVAIFALLFMPRPIRGRGKPAAIGSPPAAPGLAGVLRNDGTAGAHQVSAILVDLAIRGYLRFEEMKVSRRLERRLVRGDRGTADLEAYEAAMVEAALGDKEKITLSALRRGSRKWRDAAYDVLEKEACRRGWFRRRLRTQRVLSASLGLLLGIAGVVVLIVGANFGAIGGTATAGFGWAALAFLAAAVVVAVIGHRPARTAAGARAMAAVDAYADALGTWAGRRPVDGTLVPLVFPYAVSFGQVGRLRNRWSEVFAGLDPTWYVPAEGANGQAAATWIKQLGEIVEERRPGMTVGSTRHSRSVSRRFLSYSSSVETSGSSGDSSGLGSATWSSYSGFTGDAGGSVGGGDGGGGGGSW